MHYLLLLLALVSLSMSPVLVKLAAAPIEAICFWRLLTAGFLLQIFAYLPMPGRLSRPKFSPGIAEIKGPTAMDSASESAEISSRRRHSLKWAGITGFFFFVHLWTFVFAVQHTTVAHTVILFSTNPIFTYLISQYFLADANLSSTIRRRLWIAYPISLLGIGVLVSAEGFLESPHWKGDLMVVFSAFLHSIYLLASRQARSHLRNVEASKWINWVAALFFLTTALIAQVPLSNFSTQTWLAIAALICFPSLLGHTLFTYLVSKFPVNILSMSKLIEPILSMGLASVLIGEGLSLRTLVAFVITAFGLSLLYA